MELYLMHFYDLIKIVIFSQHITMLQKIPFLKMLPMRTYCNSFLFSKQKPLKSKIQTVGFVHENI